MIHDTMKKGEYLMQDDGLTVYRIARVKKCKEYGDKLYVLRGKYGIEIGPYDPVVLRRMGFTECLTKEELNEKWRSGEWMPPEGKCVVGNKKVKG